MAVVRAEIFLLIGEGQCLSTNHDAVSFFKPSVLTRDRCHHTIVTCGSCDVGNITTVRNNILLCDTLCIHHMEKVGQHI